MQLIFTKNYMFNSLIKITHLKISFFFLIIKKPTKSTTISGLTLHSSR